MAAMIHLDNVTRHEDAAPLVEILEGKTYMKFHVLVCPAGGSFAIHVETLGDHSEEELQGMVTMVMAQELSRLHRAVKGID